MSERPKLKLKSGAVRDPRRKPVRALTAPHRAKPPEDERREPPRERARDAGQRTPPKPGTRPPRPPADAARGGRGSGDTRTERKGATQRPAPNDRQPRSDRSAPKDRQPRGDRPAAKDRPERTDRPARADHALRTDRAPRPGGGETADRTTRRGPAPGGPDRPQRPPRPRYAAPPGGRERDERAPRAAHPPRADAARGAPPPRERPAPRRDQSHRAGTPERDQWPTPAGKARPAAAPAPRAPRAPETPPNEGVRLSKRLTEDGVASRREADAWIEAGWVRVDGRVARLGQRVQPGQRIEVDPAARREQSQRVTILLHKPIGYVSGQAEDGYEPASVLVTPENHWAEDPTRVAFRPSHTRGLAPAGRLDIDSTGLLVLTQDGRIAKTLIGEDSAIEKEYLVRVEYTRDGTLPEADLERLRHGLELDGRPLKPARVSWANEDQLRFVLREGRKRQIRRMCEAVGLKVLGLKRVRIGRVPLGKLPPGQWRYLGPFERF
jgi:23S rRNA pseudouridine2604 synthase